MKKLSFEKFASSKIQGNHQSTLVGGLVDSSSTAGGSVQLDNTYGCSCSFCLCWDSDTVGAGGGITYNNDRVCPCP